MKWAWWTSTPWMMLPMLMLWAWGHLPLPMASAKRVVHIPAPFTSHTKYHTNIARKLHDLGHQVWVTMPDYLLDKGVLDTSNLTVIRYHLSRNYEEVVMTAFRERYFSGGHDRWDHAPVLQRVCDEILRESNLEKMIRDVQPDLIVLENVPQMYTVMVLPYKLRVPYAVAGTVYDVLSTRIPYSSAVNPLQFSTFSDDMTFFERVQSLFYHTMIHVSHPFMARDVVSVYAPEMPYISHHELLARPELWLVELDHILDYPRPTVPNVKLIGGTATGPARPLPSELRSFMDGATQGVVVVSFGSYVLGVPGHISDKLFHVFRQLPMKVVYRSNLTSPDPANVFVSRWLPQNDLLGHPNTRVFVSHCGKNGQYEALFHAVPLLCAPFFADQPYNSRRIQRKGFGEVVDLLSVSQEEMLLQITSVAQEPRYKLAISKASALFRQQYRVPMEEAARWLDHVMQYGGDYMRYAGQRMPLYQFLQLDVMAFVFGLGAVCMALTYLCMKTTWKYCLTRKPKTK